MRQTQNSKEEIAQRGEELYTKSIRSKVEGEFDGKILAIDIYSGDYEIDDTTLPAVDRLCLRRSDAEIYILRIGHDVVYGFRGLPLP
ncbi:MAG: hypothetical protein JWN14_2889 [Chthonomonadales bacterium]|nr:hypothetical protein [Chthonomonadales bacterium]